MSKLSEQLKGTITQLEEARIATLNAQQAAELAKIAEAKLELEMHLRLVKDTLISQIENNKVPKYLIGDWNIQDLWLKYEAGKSPFMQVWRDWMASFVAEDLRVKIMHEHDGFGERSWLNITVVPQ